MTEQEQQQQQQKASADMGPKCLIKPHFAVELRRPQTESANSRRGLTLNQGLVDWRATLHGTRKPRFATTTDDRFWSKVDKSAGPDACWPWTAYVGDTGYGQFWNGQRLVKAHRYAYLIANGQSAQGDADHTCHNGSGCPGGSTCPHRACCNTRHLEDVTHVENVRRGEAGKQSVPWKTECVHGHAYDTKNTYIDPTGHQRCRKCAVIYQMNRKAA